MARKKQETEKVAGVEFGDWRLVPLDSSNWELAHRHATGDTASARKNGTVGKVQWHRLGKFYQFDTVEFALRYAADYEVKASCQDKVIPIAEALKEYERITKEFLEAVKGQLQKG